MFFDRPASGELAVLVHLDLHRPHTRDDLREFEELVLSAGGDPVTLIGGSRTSPNARYFVGQGKLEEIQAAVQEHCAQLVIFDHELSPSQERNLEKALQCRVLDRTGLILDIFAQRARTHEGKLQVELAQLQHMSTRLVRGWTHLERQKGGIGMRGPGETQLETDRRLLRARIKFIEARLEKVRSQREQGRRSRTRSATPTVSLAGYTNAGKSTLFNALTEADVYAANQLFATLDPTMRRITLPDTGVTVLADTVGFVRHLPHQLVEAFRSTLEEVARADLLLHVIDAASDERIEQIYQVEEVLTEIGAADVPRLEVFNKIDLLEIEPRIDRDDSGCAIRVWLSAREGIGLDLLKQAMDEHLAEEQFVGTLHLKPEQAKLRAQLFALRAITHEQFNEDGSQTLAIRLAQKDWQRLLATEKLKAEELLESPPAISRTARAKKSHTRRL
ncbi:MAG: GTPase HflX [Cellvibrionales bacterium]|nr:GTPase HflX [Cellvibrionales bacterium]MBK8676781.1 GTPase HflX [Cellvibrionales bacterium]HRF87519.1 GTPase HflX [Pseudomonadales bacterium]HRG50259.1 GTPase HflX [Pseudomonadales bacterium]